jgi:RNA exonuclease 4
MLALQRRAYLAYHAQLAALQSQLVDQPAPVFSLDVECVATGPKHTDRAVAQIALVDQNENVILNFYVKPREKIFSYMTKLTGLTEELVNSGVDIAVAVQLVRSTLPRNAVLVGQNILSDVQWLGIQEQVDFGGMLDLGALWRVFNDQYQSWTYFSLYNQAKALLGVVQEPPHNAATDAILSIRLYNLYKFIENDPAEMEKARKALLSCPLEPSFSRLNPTLDGVCMGNKKACACGAPFFF